MHRVALTAMFPGCLVHEGEIMATSTPSFEDQHPRLGALEPTFGMLLAVIVGGLAILGFRILLDRHSPDVVNPGEHSAIVRTVEVQPA